MRRLRRTRPLSQGAGLDLTPMVDVVFQLVIFFMVSTTFITLESGLPVDLPQAQTTQAQTADVPTVTITQDGRIFLAGAEVSEGDLVSALRAALAEAPDRTVVLRADQTIQYGVSVRVMDLIRQAGAERVAIATGGE
ncbi:ExbD/TolR family protein [Truepera radiovictrix]|uniref:Biopolymer transport protein ExbD/TolR n=1 Tax=Truepera radiovictrix (strain DSM 17093 / CIP 108686 / LMG 22925 / RQ-24) TaxID=649638 RepID=D7CT28_TRURR|nr:biopolymer transporter ExbD [Truepera radiovictrix]ADI15491.1 Biopolymer transport protein ExbD/TolR [Truepera radiovictrix DSM 17093]WMT55958.1 biopolymer transporter ExbD [Truepera radiovictrix]